MGSKARRIRMSCGGESGDKKFGDASLHPRTFSFNLTEECYLFFFFAFAFGFALAFAFGFAFFFAAILFSSQTL
ncbi:MAG TPA: hypothetical protein VNM47_09475 [Terriglobia bacterium]|nr:hypothetical protein [Terriglobia bacterium]